MITLSNHDYHILATALARTINRDIELLQECKESADFMRDLIIERLFLLMKLQKEAGRELQRYLPDPQTVYDNLCAERSTADMCLANTEWIWKQQNSVAAVLPFGFARINFQ